MLRLYSSFSCKVKAWIFMEQRVSKKKLLLWRLALGFGPIVSFRKIWATKPTEAERRRRTKEEREELWARPYGLCISFTSPVSLFSELDLVFWIRFHFRIRAFSLVLVLFRLNKSLTGNCCFHFIFVEDWRLKWSCLLIVLIKVLTFGSIETTLIYWGFIMKLSRFQIHIEILKLETCNEHFLFFFWSIPIKWDSL